MTNKTSKTLRLNKTRAILIKLGLNRIAEDIRLNFPNNDFIQLLTIESVCSQVIGENKTQESKEGVKKVSI